MLKGFTLIELLVVVLIVAVLTSVAMPQYRKSVERTRLAEARQMLPAIYDSVDRLVVESLCNGSWFDCRSKISFAKLDVEMKGTQDPDSSLRWKTKNFTYVIQPDSKRVYAKSTRGRWTDVKIFYNGDKFTCNSAEIENAARKSEACKMLDLDK